MAQMQLLDFSDEIFLDIFQNFNDVDLLTMAQVCKRFKEITKDTITKKYNGESEKNHYKIQVYSGSGAKAQEIQCKFIETFGNYIGALKIIPGMDKNNHLLKMISQHCRFAKYVHIWSSHEEMSYYDYDGEFKSPVTDTIRAMSKLKSLTLENLKCMDFEWTQFCYPQLEWLRLNHIINENVDAIIAFLRRNPQLKHLSMEPHSSSMNIQLLKNHLSALKSFEYNHFNNNWYDIKMENVESLKITTDVTSTANDLRAIGESNKAIKSLEVTIRGDPVDVDQTEEFLGIGVFEQLTTLKLSRFDLGIDMFRILILKSPKLTALHLGRFRFDEITTDSILHVFEKLKHLKELTITKLDLDYRNHVRYLFRDDFHKKLLNITRNRDSDIKLQLIQPRENILITKERIIVNGELVYWTVNEVPLYPSKAHLFDIGDKLLEKIFGYLDEEDHRALYETCTKMKKAMEERVKSQWFCIRNAEMAKDVTRRFGDIMTKVEIYMRTKSPAEMTETWKLVSEPSIANRITEMFLGNVRVGATGSVPVDFPNLSRLKVMSIISGDTHIFPLMNCPKLCEIEFWSFDVTLSGKVPPFGISLNNLKIIRLDGADRKVERILDSLDDEVCDQIQEFTVRNSENGVPHKIVDIAMRFRNLITFNYIHTHFEETHFEYLFRSCNKLKTVSLEITDYSSMDNWRRVLQAMKDNCKNLQVLRLYAHQKSNLFPHFIPDAVALLPKVELKKIFFYRREHVFFVGSHVNNCPKPY